ncbi:MAG: hypothetical protein ACM3SY_19040 [Candidatus Omnitrophota bacterium]
MLREIKTIKAKKLTRKEMRNIGGMACPFPCRCFKNCGGYYKSDEAFSNSKDNSGLDNIPR